MGARIRADLVGQLMGLRRDENGRPVRATPVYLSAGDEVPDGVLVSDRFLVPAGDESGPGAGAGEGGQGAGDGVPPAGPDSGQDEDPLFDPDEFTVDEVNDRLEGHPVDVVRRVLEVESSKRARHGILTGPAARRLPHSD